MSPNVPLTVDGSSVATALTILVGVIFTGYGLLLVPVSALGGLWIAAVGLSLLLSELFATEWAGTRWGLSPVTQRRLSLSFAALAVVLLAAFVAINGATVEASDFESGT